MIRAFNGKISGALSVNFRLLFVFLGQRRIMRPGDSVRDFDTSESMKNTGILDVFPIFCTARLGQKIHRSPQSPLCGVALETIRPFRLLLSDS